MSEHLPFTNVHREIMFGCLFVASGVVFFSVEEPGAILVSAGAVIASAYGIRHYERERRGTGQIESNSDIIQEPENIDNEMDA